MMNSSGQIALAGVSGRRSCVLEIGGIPIAIRSDNEPFLAQLQERYRGYLSSASTALTLDLNLEPGLSISDEDVQVRREGAEWVVERGDFRARWDLETGRGVVRQTANPYAFDSVLRILHSLLLASRGGFLLHASSAVCDGRAFLFSGVSGAGKTTMTRLAPGDVTLLTDEISYVRGAAGSYFAHGTPFAGELAQPGENCVAPVAALFLLEKGPENGIEELSSAEAMRRLMRNILFFAEDEALIEKILATACDFVSRVPVRRLVFYPDTKVWELVREFEEAHV